MFFLHIHVVQESICFQVSKILILIKISIPLQKSAQMTSFLGLGIYAPHLKDL
jgi:hypothetical protein